MKSSMIGLAVQRSDEILKSKGGASHFDDDGDDEIDVSDAEALLACWSYLQRRKRLGNWTESEQRKVQRSLSRGYFLTDNDIDDMIGTVNDEFVNDNEEDPVPKQTVGNGDDDDEEEEEFDEDNENIPEISFGSPTNIHLYEDFTSLWGRPTESYMRRSRAMKKVWNDPEYRERWYQNRWGDRRSNEEKEQIARDRKAEKLARALPRGFLGSQELASMSEVEIAEAIRTRVAATRKRVKSRQQTLRNRKDDLAKSIAAITQVLEQGVNQTNTVQIGSPPLNRATLFTRTREELEEAQRKRSERAKKKYAARLKNLRAKKETEHNTTPVQKSIPPPERKYYPPKQETPQDAIIRIEYRLDRCELPSIDDIRLILGTTRLKQRKQLLLRILNDHFGLRGKCIPIYDEEDIEGGKKPTRLEFARQCSVRTVGNFVIELLTEKENSTE
jgi:hypothetical protein